MLTPSPIHQLTRREMQYLVDKINETLDASPCWPTSVHINIAGAGVVGAPLAEQLSRENHDIVLIEADRNRA